MTPGEEAIRDGLRQDRLSPDEALALVRAELAATETASLLVLQGILIQLSDSQVETLEAAQACFERATQLDPDHPEAYEELGHYFDAVMPNREKAEAFYRLALSKGAGRACKEALAELLARDSP